MNTKDKFYYFDNNATTRIAPEVLEAMMPFLTDFWGNPSSAYGFGEKINQYIVKAREQLSALINAEPENIVFTSCGTESNNTAFHTALNSNPKKRHVLTTAVEHSTNIAHGKHLQRQGYQITFLPVEPDGSLDLCLLTDSIREDTAIVSVMWANNETGVVLPIEEIAAICRVRGVPFHTDAVQVAGKIPIDVQTNQVDFLSLSSHKLYAPKGTGILYIKPGTPFSPYLFGGGQEKGRRGGTENVAGIVGFGKAAEMALADIGDHSEDRKLRDKLESGLMSAIPGTVRNGAKEPRLPNTSYLAFEGVEAEAMLIGLDQLGICVSAGSACKTGAIEPSHVLTAMGIKSALAKSSIRFSLGRYNREEEVDFLLEKVPEVVKKIRAASPETRLKELSI
jgi:cysteine desulfurase